MANKTPGKVRDDVNWTQVELAFRAGIKTLRAIADDYGITEGAIRARAKKYGWLRDLEPRVAARTEELLRKEALRKPITHATRAEEEQAVENDAQMRVAATLSHRKDVVELREVYRDMVGELRAVTGNPMAVEALVKAVAQDNDVAIGKELNKALSLTSRFMSLDKAASVLVRLIDTERKLLGIDKQADGADDKLAKCIESARRLIAEREANGES